jgi:Type I phosphodiesterase / nucleotide pyrophosphatase
MLQDACYADFAQRYPLVPESGFARLLEQGAVFTNAHYLHAATNTAPGHATFLSGAPAID